VCRVVAVCTLWAIEFFGIVNGINCHKHRIIFCADEF